MVVEGNGDDDDEELRDGSEPRVRSDGGGGGGSCCEFTYPSGSDSRGRNTSTMTANVQGTTTKNQGGRSVKDRELQASSGWLIGTFTSSSLQH